MATYFLIDKRSGEIVNACDVDYGPPPSTKHLEEPDQHEYVIESQVPLAKLQRYRYWNERP